MVYSFGASCLFFAFCFKSNHFPNYTDRTTECRKYLRGLSGNWGSWCNKLVFLHFWKCSVFLRCYGFTFTSPIFLVLYNEALDMYVVVWHLLVLSFVSGNRLFTKVYFQTLYIVSKVYFLMSYIVSKFIFRQKIFLFFLIRTSKMMSELKSSLFIFVGLLSYLVFEV